MIVSAQSQLIDVPPGGSAEVVLDVRNTSEIIDGITTRIIGAPSAQVVSRPVLLPLFTTRIFHSGASAYGLLSAVMAVGSLTGALLAAQRGTARIRMVLGGAVAFGVLEAISAAMPDFATFALLLLLTGTAGLTVATTANAVMQTSVTPQLRGRVMGVYLLVFMGGTPIGSPLVGWMAGSLGVRWTLALCGVATALSAVSAAYALAWRTDRRIMASVTSRPHLAVVPRTA